MKISPAHILGDIGLAISRLRCGQMGLLFRDKPTLDYGVDAEIEIVANGYATGRLIGVQIKCGPSFFKEEAEDNFVFRFEGRHLEYWDQYSLPVIVILIDDNSERGYWAPITKEGAISTGAGFKILVPKSNVFASDAKADIVDLANPVVASSAYERILEQDLSSGIRRELTHYVVLKSREKPWTKPAVTQIILQETAKARASDYFRNEITRAQHEGSEPEIVRLFVYHSRHEKDLGDYVAKAIWVAESVPNSEFAPSHLRAGLTVEWNEQYGEISEKLDELRSSKRQYLDFYVRRLRSLTHLVFKYYELLILRPGLIREEWIEFDCDAPSILDQFEDCPIPPIECLDFDNRLHDTLGLLKNARILARRLISNHDGRTQHQAEEYLREAHNMIRLASYEYNKFGH